MKLHEQRETLILGIDKALADAKLFVLYLASDKFQGNDDWIRTWEAQKVMAGVIRELSAAREDACGPLPATDAGFTRTMTETPMSRDDTGPKLRASWSFTEEMGEYPYPNP